ncbi:MAG: tyrosine transporter, partial [Chlamydiia bacterium]|nr:tyrosine transporter [Chlamydiia bacterium]
GLLPSLVLMGMVWVFMTFSAFCFLEVNLWIEGDTDIISMAGHTLGKGAQYFAWFAYIFLLYSVTTAYIALSAPILTDLASSVFGVTMPTYAAPLPMLLLFAYILYKGTAWADLANRWLMLGLALAYILLVVYVAPHMEPALLQSSNWTCLGLGFSVIATSFGYHIIIPSLTNYMRRDHRQMARVLIIGGLIPLIVNGLWETLALGTIPVDGPHGLKQGFVTGQSSALLLKEALSQPMIAHGARALSLFAITTSFLGVTLSLFHFLSDGLKIRRSIRGRTALSLLTFVPPLLLVWTYPRAALLALEYAGVIGVIILLGFMPCLMVWGGRYWKRLPPSEFRVPGGKPALMAAMLFAALAVACEVALQLGYLQSCVEELYK